MFLMNAFIHFSRPRGGSLFQALGQSEKEKSGRDRKRAGSGKEKGEGTALLLSQTPLIRRFFCTRHPRRKARFRSRPH